MYEFKECSSYGTIYNKSCGCSKGGFVDKFVRDPNKIPDSSQRPPHDCLKCGNPVDGLNCRQCAILRKKLKEVWFTICDEHKIFQDFLNTSESLNDNTNVINAPQDPFVFNQDPGKNSSQSPPHIDPLLLQVLLLAWDRVSKIKDAFGNKQYKPKDIQELFHKLFNDVQNIHGELAEYINTPSWNRPAFYKNDKDDDEDYTIAMTPDFLITDSLSMRDEHLSTIPETESDKLIKSSVENLVPNLSESEDLSNIETDCDPEEEVRLIEKFLYDNSSPRPPKEFNSKNSDAVIKSFSPSPIPVEDSDSLMEEIDLSLTSNDSMPPGIENDDYESKRDILFLEELLNNDSLSLPENESFHFDVLSSPRPPAKPPDDDEIKPNMGLLTTKVMGDISEHYVLMPRLLPTQPTLCPVIDTLFPFSSKNEDKVHLLSHQGFKTSQFSFESPMMIYGGNVPTLEVSFLYFYPP
nr:hypothetical protein [Tanacetum cinerariifolium]